MNLDPETQAELNRQRINEEMQAIHLQNKVTRGKNLFSKGLVFLGTWMISIGIILRKKNSLTKAYPIKINKQIAHR